MKHLLLLTFTPLLLALSSTLSAADAPQSVSKPNIIFILADDLGIGNVSCYGADNFRTPNIDKLATSGLRFEHCYSSPLCGPSRALLMTGRYAYHTGMTSNQSGPRLSPTKEIMMPRMIKPAGYVTAMCGKWSQLPLQPSDWGFDEYLRFVGSGQYWNTQKFAKTYTVNGKEVPLRNGEYLPDKMSDFVVNFIQRHKDQPFYIYYSMSHVHEQIPADPKHPMLPTPDTKPGTTSQFRLFQDNVAYMDKLVGKLIAELNRLKLRDNTLIVFAGDNGTAPDFYVHSTIHGHVLSGCKASMLECGALVPCIVNWPGKVPAGKVPSELINTVDFYRTLGKIGGASMPSGLTIDGQDFSTPLLGQGDTWPRDWIYVQLDQRWYDRDQNWKLNQEKQLFDMRKAPFFEVYVPFNTQDTAAIAARKKLETVLDQLNPAGGIVGQTNGKKKAGGGYERYLERAGPTHGNPNPPIPHEGRGGNSQAREMVNPGNQNEPGE